MEGLKPGGKVHLGYGDRVTTAAISRVYPALGKNILGSVEMVLPALPFGLPSGSTVGVDLVRKAVTGVIVPENALVRSCAGTFVCVVKDGVVRIRKVTLLGADGGKAALAGELAPGEQVAVGQEEPSPHPGRGKPGHRCGRKRNEGRRNATYGSRTWSSRS